MGSALSKIAQLVSVGASPPIEQLVRALWFVSSITLVLDLTAGLYQQAKGPVFGHHKTAYYAILAVVLAVVAVEMATAYWLPLPGARPKLASFAKHLLRLAVLLLLVIIAVGGYGLTVKV